MHLQYLTPETQNQLLQCSASSYSMAVAIATAYSLPRPMAVVNDLQAQWEGAAIGARGIIGWFNEARPLDPEEVLDCTAQIWKSLYEVAVGVYLENTTCSNSVLDIFGIGYHLSVDKCQELCANAPEITKVMGACVKAARQMQLTQVTEATQ